MMDRTPRTVKGWPWQAAVVHGALLGLATLGATTFWASSRLAGALVIAAAMLALLLYARAAGQLRLDGEAHTDQGVFIGVMTLVFGVGASLIHWYTEPVLTGPLFAVAVAGLYTWGIHRWGAWYPGAAAEREAAGAR